MSWTPASAPHAPRRTPSPPWPPLCSELWKEATRSPSKKVDVYAFGILLQRLFTEGEDPYHQFVHAQDRVARIKEFVVSGRRPGPDPRVPHAVRRLVLECLQDAPRTRPSFVDVRCAGDRRGLEPG